MQRKKTHTHTQTQKRARTSEKLFTNILPLFVSSAYFPEITPGKARCPKISKGEPLDWWWWIFPDRMPFLSSTNSVKTLKG